MKIWEQRPDEDDKKYGYFKLFLEFQSKNLKEFSYSIGESYSQIRKHSAKFEWMNRRAAYEADKAAGSVTDNSKADNVEDWMLAASHSRLLAFKAENATPENTGDNFNLSSEQLVQKNAVDGAFGTKENPADSTTLLPVADLPSPLVRTLDQLAADFNCKIEQGDSRVKEGLLFYIDAGKDLNTAKALCKHGDWENWLKTNSKYPIRRTQKYMQLADRFGYLVDKPEIAENLSVTQMFELLSLPEGEEQNFIDKLTAEGKALADMTQKETRAEVKGYNEELAAARAEADKERERADSLQEQLSLFGDKLKDAEAETRRFSKEFNDQLTKTQTARQEVEAAQKVIDRQAAENTALQSKIEELENKPPVTVEVEKEIIPPDYESNKKALADSQEQILKLQEQINAAPADTVKRAEVFTKLTATADILASLDDTDKNFIQDFAREYPDKFKTICTIFKGVD